MPNMKLFVDKDLLSRREAEIAAMLAPLRDLACRELAVPASACQLAVIGVIGLPDQPLANLEFQYLATPARTPARIGEVCAAFRAFLVQPLDTSPAIRATPLDPATYVALK
jgi:hypothetical protein